VKLLERLELLAFALINTVVSDDTELVNTVNVAVVCPAGITTVDVTDAALLSTASETDVPPAGAGASMVTVPVAVAPDVIVDGLTTRLLTWARVSVSVVDLVPPAVVAEILAAVSLTTGVVVTVKVLVVSPAETVTDCGTVASDLLLLSETVRPPAGAGPFSVTVPVEFAPPRTLVGASVSVAGAGARTFRVTDALVSLALASSLTSVSTATGLVETVNVALDCPTATFTVLGTVAAAFALVILTTAPPAGAGAVSLTVAVTFPPPRTAA
jgi:hypothetical protein